MSQEIKKQGRYILTVQNKKEREILYKYCIKNNIEILYPELFTCKKIHHIWCIDSNTIGLCGTIIASNTPKENILNINDLN